MTILLFGTSCAIYNCCCVFISILYALNCVLSVAISRFFFFQHLQVNLHCTWLLRIFVANAPHILLRLGNENRTSSFSLLSASAYICNAVLLLLACGAGGLQGCGLLL